MTSNRFARVVLSSDAEVILVDLFNEEFTYRLPADSIVKVGSVVAYSHTGKEEAPVRVESVHAGANSATASLWYALSQHGLDPEFPEAVMQEVATIVNTADLEDPQLPDLTDLPFVTIDNVDSKDLDQAMHLASTDDGYLLQYALADAAHYVVPGSALFAEALRRGASYYMPGFSVPMLPGELSEGLISLNEGQLRRALVFKIQFDHQGDVLTTAVFQARIKSAAKLSYSGVEQYYNNPATSDLSEKSYTATLDVLRVLGRLRIQESRRRNVVEYDRTGVEIELSYDGGAYMIREAERLDVERYNEQISLVCNSEGARLLESAGMPSVVQAVYRIHDAPDEERLKKFSRLLSALIEKHQLSPPLWVWRWRNGKYGGRETLASYLQRLRDAKVDARLLSAVQRHALMLSPASRFAAIAGEHHSLKLEQYARFSSPMREIAGIYTHRELLQYQHINARRIENQSTDKNYDDEDLRQQVIDAANRSKEVQKKLNKEVLKKAIDQLFEPELLKAEPERSVWCGTILSLRSTRVYVRLDKPAIVVKVYLRDLSRLSGIDYQLDKSSAFIIDKRTGKAVFVVGEQLLLKAYDYADDSQRWWLVPVQS